MNPVPPLPNPDTTFLAQWNILRSKITIGLDPSNPPLKPDHRMHWSRRIENIIATIQTHRPWAICLNELAPWCSPDDIAQLYSCLSALNYAVTEGRTQLNGFTIAIATRRDRFILRSTECFPLSDRVCALELAVLPTEPLPNTDLNTIRIISTHFSVQEDLRAKEFKCLMDHLDELDPLPYYVCLDTKFFPDAPSTTQHLERLSSKDRTVYTSVHGTWIGWEKDMPTDPGKVTSSLDYIFTNVPKTNTRCIEDGTQTVRDASDHKLIALVINP